MRIFVLFSLAVISFFGYPATAQAPAKPAKIGRLNTPDFEARIEKAVAAIQAMPVSKVALQTADLKAVNEAALLLHQQIGLGQQAATQTNDEEVRIYAAAQARLYQTMLTKLEEMGREKKFLLPTANDARVPQMVGRMQKLTVKPMHGNFLPESAMAANDKLANMLMEARAYSKEANFKQLIALATPGIRTLLQVASPLRDRLAPMMPQ